jgi:hypothetical protein
MTNLFSWQVHSDSPRQTKKVIAESIPDSTTENVAWANNPDALSRNQLISERNGP